MWKLSYCQVALLVVLVCVPGALSGNTSQSFHSAAVKVGQLTQMKTAFTENRGQWDERVRFRANSGGATLWFTADGISYHFTRRISRDNLSAKDQLSGRQMSTSAPSSLIPHDELNHEPDSVEHIVIKASFVGANLGAEIIGENMMEYKCNYFIGNDPSKWRTDVPNYSSVLYKEVYPGIDIRLCSTDGSKIVYEVIAAPNADMKQVRVEYEGINELSVDRDELLPLSGQTSNPDAPLGQTRHTSSLLLDLDYSTYLGGSEGDFGEDIAIGHSGSAFVTGSTYSPDFPTLSPFQETHQGEHDVFVTKLSSSGSSLIYSTYLGGGNNDDVAFGIAVDASGAAYVTGHTRSTDFPTLNPYQTYQGEHDAFVTKLSSSGNSLVYSTYLGGSSYDHGYGIALTGSGVVHVVGSTSSSDFPVVNPYQETLQGDNDAFVSKLTSSGSDLLYSTYLGGSGSDYGWRIAVDDLGEAYVTGKTFTADFPTVNPFQTHQGMSDAFVTKVSITGSSLLYSTYLGGSKDDASGGITVDGSGAAYVVGGTNSIDFPTLNHYQTDQGWDDAFVTKFSVTGNSIVYSTYLGGSNSDWASDIAVNSFGEAYVTGSTVSTDFPTLNAYQADQEEQDVFITKVSVSGDELVYSTYLGGESDYERASGIAVDSTGATLVVGASYSSDFPVADPYQTYQGAGDAFVAKLVMVDFLCGDVDVSAGIDIDDVVYLIAFIFTGGPEPQPYESGDVNCSGAIDIDDVVWLIAFIFTGGNTPCDTDGDSNPDC